LKFKPTTIDVAIEHNDLTSTTRVTMDCTFMSALIYDERNGVVKHPVKVN